MTDLSIKEAGLLCFYLGDGKDVITQWFIYIYIYEYTTYIYIYIEYIYILLKLKN